jgi:hypothetical protein
LALTVTAVTNPAGPTGAESTPLLVSVTALPPLAVESARTLPVDDMASASRVTNPVAEYAGSTVPATIVTPLRTNAPTKREVRFMMTSAIGDDRRAAVRRRLGPCTESRFPAPPNQSADLVDSLLWSHPFGGLDQTSWSGS